MFAPQPNVVVLTTYPLTKPRHGGQIRARALAESYKQAGFTVSCLSVYEQGAFPADAVGPLDIPFPVDDARWFLDGRATAATSDLRSGLFAASDEGAYGRIRRSLPARVDVFHLEQPWLLPLVSRLKTDRAFAKSVVVYGSQNVEAPLREIIFRSLKISAADAIVARIDALEREACQVADLTLAVAPKDLATLVKFAPRQLMHAPNGISRWQGKPELVEQWRTKVGARRIALFVGSAHAPNIDGFFRAVGDSLGFVPPDCKIVVGGAVGTYIVDALRRGRYSVLNMSRILATGELDDDDLSALKTVASVFLLPIFDGGGSNIKTAEAIYSRRHVVATEISLRGYEAFMSAPEIYRADTSEQFRGAVRHALSPSTKLTVATARDVQREKLLWENCLAEVPLAVTSLLASA